MTNVPRHLESLAVVAVVLLGTALCLAHADQTADAAPRVSMEAFRKLHSAGHVLVVDVRNAVSYKTGHIPGAISVPVDEVDKRAGEIRADAKGRTIVTYCSCPSEHTSGDAALVLIKKGMKDVRALVGGYPEWVATGGEIER